MTWRHSRHHIHPERNTNTSSQTNRHLLRVFSWDKVEKKTAMWKIVFFVKKRHFYTTEQQKLFIIFLINLPKKVKMLKVFFKILRWCHHTSHFVHFSVTWQEEKQRLDRAGATSCLTESPITNSCTLFPSGLILYHRRKHVLNVWSTKFQNLYQKILKGTETVSLTSL